MRSLDTFTTRAALLALATGAIACGSSAQSAPASAASPPAVETTAAAPAVAAAATPVATEETKASETVDDITSKKFGAARSYFNATMTEALPVSKLAAVWDGVEAKYGAYQGKTLAGTEGEAGAKKAIDYDLAFANGHLTAHVAFDHGQITGLFFKPK